MPNRVREKNRTKKNKTKENNNNLQDVTDETDISVLIIESNNEMQRLLRAMLNSCSIREVRVHSNSERAATTILAEPPDLVLLDWDVKPFDGPSFLKMIRNKNMYPVCLVPIIVMLSEARKSWVEKALKLGAHAIIAKPISPSTIMERIRWIRAGHRELRLEGNNYVIEGTKERLAIEEERKKQMASAREYQASQFAEMMAIQNDIDKILQNNF